MEKIAFVIGLYGEEVNGGAEKHCKMLAEHLVSHYSVEVLTSTTSNYVTFEPFYTEGTDYLNKIKVTRFRCNPFDPKVHEKARKKGRLGRKIRRLLFKTGILTPLANLFSRWSIGLEKELEILKSHGLYSERLIQYVRQHYEDYKVIVLLSYPNPNFYFINELIPEKCLLIPTAHNEGDIFRSFHTHLFTTVRHIAFNTETEEELCRSIFGNKMSKSSILAVGIDLAEPAGKEYIYQKFHLPQRYILYFGRISEVKINKLIAWFLDYKRITKDDVKLVLTGEVFMDKLSHDEIIYTGFVTESEKTALIQHCQLVVNPSDKESLSLLLLETMSLGKPALVNGASEVMRQHSLKSGYAVEHYLSKSEFIKKMTLMLIGSVDDQKIREKAMQYVKENYAWDVIVGRFREILSFYS